MDPRDIPAPRTRGELITLLRQYPNHRYLWLPAERERKFLGIGREDYEQVEPPISRRANRGEPQVPIDKSLTPRQLAERIGIGEDKVRNLIRSGELGAVNVAENPNGKPRWKILPEQWADFVRRRSNH